MSQIDASDYSSLKTAVEEKSNDELVSTIQHQEGGVDGVLDKVFAGMSESLAPTRRPASSGPSSTSSAPRRHP